MLSDPVARLTFFKELETKIRNSSVVGLAATEATPDDAWENLMQIIQETTGPYLHQGAPRPGFGTKTSTTGTWYTTTSDRLLKRSESCGESKDRDHTSGETDASIFSLALEKTKGNLAEGTGRRHPKTGRFHCLLVRTSPRWHRHRVETPSFWTNSSLHPFSDRMGTSSGKRRAKGRSCTNTRGLTSDESVWSFWTLAKAKRPRPIGKRLEQTTIAH